jgi:hypothetical protein
MANACDRALEGLKVLDFSIMMAGPYCARLMADLGADVVKVEPPEGDDMRLRAPLRAAPDGSRHSTYFGQLNAGKRSIALDLKHDDDLATDPCAGAAGRRAAGELPPRRDGPSGPGRRDAVRRQPEAWSTPRSAATASGGPRPVVRPTR